MKLTVIISTMLIAQVSASFFDVFQGAMLSVQNGFGKLLSDVVTDVKDTVDCTILAVEHVLAWSEDATKLYYDKCGSGTKNATVQSQLKEENSPTIEISILSNEEYLKKEIPEEIDARINATLTRFLNGYNPYARLENIEKELAKETQRLADVSEFVKLELDKLSHEIHNDFRRLVSSDSKPSIDNILHKLKMLEAVEKNLKNRSEANEVHQVIDNVLQKMKSIEYSEAGENTKIEKNLKDLETNSNSSYKVIRQQLKELQEEENRHLDLIKNKIQQHEKTSEHLNFVESHNVNKTEIIEYIASFNNIVNSSMTERNYPSLPTKQPLTKSNDFSDTRYLNIAVTSPNTSSTTIPISTNITHIYITPSNYYSTVSVNSYDNKTNNVSVVKTTQSINSIITTAITENPSLLTTDQGKTTPEKLKSSTVTSNKDRTTVPTTIESKEVTSALKTETINQMNNVLNITNPQAFSTVQINDASEITTPIAIIRSSYVNVNNHKAAATTTVNIDSSLLRTIPTTIFLKSLSQVTNEGLLSDLFLNQALEATKLISTTETNVVNVSSTTNLSMTSPEISTQESSLYQTKISGIESTSKSITPLIVVQTTNSEDVSTHGEQNMRKSDRDLIDGIETSTSSKIKERTHKKDVVDIHTSTYKPIHSTAHSNSVTTLSMDDYLKYIDRMMAKDSQEDKDKYATTSSYRSTEKVNVQPKPPTKSPMNTDWNVPPKYMPPQIKPPNFENSLNIVTPHNELLRFKRTNNPAMLMKTGLIPPTGNPSPSHKYPKRKPTTAHMNAPITPRPIPPPPALKVSRSGVRSRHTGRNRQLSSPPRLKPRQFRKDNEYSPPIQSYNKAIRPPDTFNQSPLNIDRTTMITTTAVPLTSPKSSILDPDFNSFFHTSTKKTEAHQNAVKDARQLIEESRRQQRIIDSILNKKKGQN